jgi:hypothetical protein
MHTARLAALFALLVSCAPARGSDPEARAAAPSLSARPGAAPVDPAARPHPDPRPEPEPEPTPAARVYDLASDVAERAAQAETDLGAGAEVAVVEGVFVVAGPPRAAPGSFRGALDVVRRALAAYFNGRFSQRPERAVSVYLFPSARPYDAFCKTLWDGGCRSPYGVYLAERRMIVMNVGPGIGTLTHELVHPLMEADFPDAPDWLDEGIASLYEGFHFPGPNQIAGGKNWRHPRLLAAFGKPGERELASLPALFAMDDATFRGRHEDLNYATARYFCLWLERNKWLWSFYQRWRDGFASDPTGERAFREVTGMTPAEANGRWLRWVRAL